MPLIDRSANLLFAGSLFNTKTVDPKFLIWSHELQRPVQISYGISPCRLFDRHLLRMWFTVVTAIAQNIGGNLDCINKHLVMSSETWFLHSGCPFYCGFLTTESRRSIPWPWIYASNSPLTYSFLLSDSKHLIFLPVCFSASDLYILKASGTQHFCLRKYTSHHLEHWSINVTNYLAPLCTCTLNGLTAFECTICNTSSLYLTLG